MIKGEQIYLQPYSREDCHEFYTRYISDSQMTNDEFIYDNNKIDSFYSIKTSEENRLMFGIFHKKEIVGEIQLKYINFKDGYGTLSIILRDDSVKGKGYGTEAEKLLIEYAFKDLNLNKILADTTIRNERSKHILIKLGFEFLKDENDMS